MAIHVYRIHIKYKNIFSSYNEVQSMFSLIYTE